MLITDPPGIDPSQLRERMEGRVSAPGDTDWDEARQAWNLAVDQRPAAVAIPATAADVVAVVEFARERGLLVTAQGTGHNAGAYDTLANTILVKTHELRGVEIDAEARIARCQAGTLWAEVTQPASELGLAPLAGSSPDVGVVGYVARRRPLVARPQARPRLQQRPRDRARDRRRRARPRHPRRPRRPVLGAARRRRELRHRDRRRDRALRLPDRLRRDDAVAVGARRRGPQGLGRVDPHRARRGQHERAPDPGPAAAGHPRVPPGRAFVAIDGAFLGDEAAAAELFAPLRALEPEMDSFGPMAPGGLSFIHMDPEGPTPGIGGHTMLGELDDEAIDAFVAVAGAGSGTPLVMAELRQLGGAVARSGEHHGAVDVMPGEFALFAVGIPMSPEVGAAVHAHLPKLIGAMAKWDAGTAYMNFAEDTVDPATFYSADGYARLRHVKAEVDPAGLFRGNHAISAD